MTFGPTGPGPASSPPPYSYGPAPMTPQPQNNKMATWSIVFAFLFAPLGAVLGHFALSDIRDYHQRGRDRALIGLILSYTVIVIAAGALLIWAIAPTRPVLSATAPIKTTLTAPPLPTSQTTSPTPTSTQPPGPPLLSQTDLPPLLLNSDELKAIMGTSSLPQIAESNPALWPPGAKPSGPDETDPPQCLSSVLAAVSSVYPGGDTQGYDNRNFADRPSHTNVAEGVFAFTSADSAKEFVKQQFDLWRGCSGKAVTFTEPGQPPLNWNVGNVAVGGDRISLQNVLLTGVSGPSVRILAAKNNVVVDVGVFARQLADQPQAIADQILARIPG